MFPFNLISLIPGLFNTVNGITNAIANERLAVISAKTDQERIHAQERLNTLQTQRDVLVADASHSKLDMWVRTAIAIGPTVYILKYFIWDKALNSLTDGSTPGINSDMAQVLVASIGFYFLYSGAVGITKILKA